MTTAALDQDDGKTYPEWVFYDGACPMCIRLARIGEVLLHGRHIGFTPLQTPWVKERFHIAEDAITEMKVLTVSEGLLGGADGFIYLSRKLWWGFPFSFLAQVPGMKFILRKIYKIIARNRYCWGGSCKINRGQRTE